MDMDSDSNTVWVEQAQREKGTEAQRHKGAEAQRNRGTEAQRNRGTEGKEKNFVPLPLCPFAPAVLPLCPFVPAVAFPGVCGVNLSVLSMRLKVAA